MKIASIFLNVILVIVVTIGISSGKKMASAKTDDGSMSGMSMGGMSMSPSNSQGNEPGEFSVPVERQQQIGVTYASAERRPIQLSIRSVGEQEIDLSPFLITRS